MQTISVLSNNIATNGFKEEHGFSILINYKDKNILFDTGYDSAFRYNVKKLNINLNDIHYMILSHGHYDHCGNIQFILDKNPNIKTFLHPEGLKDRYSIHRDRDPMLSSIGITKNNRESLIKNNPIYSNNITNVYKNMYITGTIPRLSTEDTGGPFFIDPNGIETDNITDDQSLYIIEKQGLIIITGCCHSGIINTVEYIKKVSGITKVRTIIGGLHLSKAKSDRVENSIKYINELNLESIYPGHCTGENVIKTLKKRLNCSVVELYAGNTIII